LNEALTIQLGAGEGMIHFFTRRMGYAKGQGESLPYITVTQQYQHPIQKIHLNMPCSIWSNSGFLRAHH